MEKICAALATNTALRWVNLCGHITIGPKGAQILAASLAENTTLTTLLMDNARIGDVGAIAMGNALKTNSTLTDLNIGANGIRAQGAVSLAAGLRANSGIVRLNLSHNEFGSDSKEKTDAAVGALATAIEKNTTLKTLLLHRA